MDFVTTCTHAPVINCQGWCPMKPSNMQTKITLPPWTDASRNTPYVMDVIRQAWVLLGWHLFAGDMTYFSNLSLQNCRQLTLLLCTVQNRMGTSHIPDAAKCGFEIFLGQATMISFIELLSISIKTACKHRWRIWNEATVIQIPVPACSLYLVRTLHAQLYT